MSATPSVSVPAGSKDRDWLIALVGGLGALIAAALLSRGSPPLALSPELGRPVAAVAFSASDVRRRPARTLVWEELDTGAIVHEQDAIFVPPGSAARIAFEDGSFLEVDENSLLVVEPPSPDRTRARVALRKGSLSGATSSRALEIRGPGGVAELARHSEAQVEVAQGKATVAVFQGSARLATALGERTFQAGEGGGASESGWFNPPRYPIELEAPQRNERLFYTGQPPVVTLRWEMEADAPSARVQVSRDRAFGFVVASAPATGGELAFRRGAAGIFWWRLVDEEGAPLSEARRFSLVEDVPPRPITPAPGAMVLATEARPLTVVWRPLKGVGTYRVELSRDPDFHHLEHFASAGTHHVRVTRALPEGVYYWRVRADEPERGESRFSEPRSFRLIHKPLPEAPELLSPEIEVESEVPDDSP